SNAWLIRWVNQRELGAAQTAKVGHGLMDDVFGQTTVTLDLSHQHRTLNHRQTEVGELFLMHVRIEPTARFLLHEKGGDLRLRDLEDQTQILSYEFIVLRYFVANRAEWASACHLIALLQRDLRTEPSLEIVP